ncbi:MAG: hypothetical protein M0R17_01500 [Candidatus Omnitrophica bacterium]|jgi:hypothetical protein|nr:hypothetical protein [Candidatus Omnitrophota bacterium]
MQVQSNILSWDIPKQRVIANNFEQFKSLCKPGQVWLSNNLNAPNPYLHLGNDFDCADNFFGSISGQAKWRDFEDYENPIDVARCTFSIRAWPLKLIYDNGEKLAFNSEFRGVSLGDDHLLVKTNKIKESKLLKKEAWDNNDILGMFGGYEFKNFRPNNDEHLSYAGWLVKGIGDKKRLGYGVCLPIIGFSFSMTRIQPRYNDFDIVWGNGSIEKAMDCYKAYCNGEKVGPKGGNLGYCWDSDPSKSLEKIKFVGLPEVNSNYWKYITSTIDEAKKSEESGIFKKNNPFKQVLKDVDAPKEESKPSDSNYLRFDQQQMSPAGLERNKQHLIDEYLDDLAQAKVENNTEKIDKINRMLQYLSAESSLKFSWDLPLNKIKFRVLFRDEDNSEGTHLIGKINTTYDVLLKVFGKPTSVPEDEQTAIWIINIEDPEDEYNTIVATVYDWKIGKGYFGEDGLDLEDITEWNVGGKTHRAVELIEKIIEENLDSKLSWNIPQFT